MNYYGETSLYLFSTAGNFDCRVTLDKEGPIHDVAWSPDSKEFEVVYGCMPAKAMIFDALVRKLHDFGSALIDIVDRRTLTKFATIEALNTSYCAWSPCSRFLLTTVFSPRLRVDNGTKIWHCTGPLMHVQPIDELYQAGWRPTPVDQKPAFGQTLPPAPQLAPSTASATVNGKSPSAKPPGTYCHLGARGLPTPVMFRQKHEGGTPMVAEIATPPRGYSGPNPSKALY
ncbi:hypothetical protein ID866_10308 [Astraeus odoratus]|nr:hypothetical protein ID866_10308 [Astraeus odoratus]